MLLNIRHQTVVRYAHPVNYSIQQLRLTPRADTSQRAVNWRIAAPGKQRRLTDAYGNLAHVLTLDQLHDEICILVSGAVETVDQGGHILQENGGAVSPLAYLAETPLTRADEAILELARRHIGGGRERVHELRDLMPAICDGVAHYLPEEEVIVPAARALADGRGASQDHAHLFIACCRARGIPARYVSGYLGLAGNSDAAHHAWADAWIEQYGWVSFDVTHRRLAGREYCRLAVGRDYLDACPVRGANRGEARKIVSVHVTAQQ